MLYSTKIPYKITSHRYENENFILTSDHYYDQHIMNILSYDDSGINNYNSTTFIYEFKTPIVPKVIHFKRSADTMNFALGIYYWDDNTSQWILLKKATVGMITTIDETFDIDIKTTKIKIVSPGRSQFSIYWCTLDYEAESKTVKNLVSSAITENELFQQLTVPCSAE